MRKKNSNIWLIAREYNGLAGSGGIKDFCRQYAEALAETGKLVQVVLPFYGFIRPEDHGFSPAGISFEVDMPYVNQERLEQVTVWQQHRQNIILYLIDAERFREKKGVYTYTAVEEHENPGHQQGSGHYDYFAMNVLLQKAAIRLMMLGKEPPDIIHGQDGHTALLPAMIHEIEGFRDYFKRTGCVVTIHNAGLGYHQEVADLPFAQAITGLPARIITENVLNNCFDPLLTAARYAVMNTVSENYARELQETDDDALTGWLGHLLKERGVTLEGVTNGISPRNYDPARPLELGLPAGFDPATGDVAGKKKCRQALTQWLQTRDKSIKADDIMQSGSLTYQPGQPLFTFVGRFTVQKGVDKLAEALETLFTVDKEFQVLALGAGPKQIEQSLVRLAEKNEIKDRLCVLRGYDQNLANQLYAAGDFFLIPSRYEPCGFTDFIAQLFGNIPIVHHVGGLVKVHNDVTGFSYSEHSAAALMEAMLKAMKIFRTDPGKIIKMQQAAIRLIHNKYTWDKVVSRYEALYAKALELVR